MSPLSTETEKNLAALFDRAEHGGMILFFDDADSLFGKHTETRTSFVPQRREVAMKNMR